MVLPSCARAWATARKLAQKALLTLGDEQVGKPFKWAPKLYTLEAEAYNRQGTLVIHAFAVNPWTGDVWEPMGCERITSATIEREQAAIRKRATLTAKT